MKLADKACYPHPQSHKMLPEQAGLTFKERLIIALASNAEIVENAWDNDGMPTMNTDKNALVRNAQSIINQADAIIKEMEIEGRTKEREERISKKDS